MADVNFNCPHCGQNLDAPEEMAGQTLDCPACSQPMVIPAPPAPQPPAPPAADEVVATPPEERKRIVLRRPVVAPTPPKPVSAPVPRSPTATFRGPAPAAPAPAAASSSVRRIAEPLFAARGWMKFLGILWIVAGVLQGITIVGLVVAWIPFWMGMLLKSAANAIAEAQEKNSEAALTLALGKLRTFFKIMGIMALIGMALAVLSVLILIPLALLARGRMESPAVVPMPQG